MRDGHDYLAATPAKVRALLSLFGSPQRPAEFAGERLWLEPNAPVPVAAWLPATPSFVVLSAKRSPLDWWREAGEIAKDVGLIHALFPSDPRTARLVGKVVPRGVPVVFLGDLDPVGIIQFLELRRTAPFGRRLVPGGVNSGWLSAMARRLRPQVPIERLRIRLSAEETRLFAALAEAVDLKRLLGASAVALLRDGFKLELEGATNPRLFGPGRPWALPMLRRAASAGGPSAQLLETTKRS